MIEKKAILLKPWLLLSVVCSYLFIAGCGGDPAIVYKTEIPADPKATITFSHLGSNSDSTVLFFGLAKNSGTDACQNLAANKNLLFSAVELGQNQAIYTTECSDAASGTTSVPIHYCIQTSTHVYSSKFSRTLSCGQTYTSTF